MASAASVSAEERSALVFRGCAGLFTLPRCRRAWNRAATLDPDTRAKVVVDECRRTYCPRLGSKGKKLALCRLAGLPALEKLKALWRPLHDEIAAIEFPEKRFDGFNRWRRSLGVVLFPIVIKVDPPGSQGAPPPPKPTVGLKLIITTKGILIRSRLGIECPATAGVDPAVCFPVSGRTMTKETERKLALHMWWLFATRFADPKHWGNDPNERHALAVVPGKKVPYPLLIQTLDAIRSIPRGATTPPSPKNLPPKGCTLAGAPSKHGCMYYRVTVELPGD